MQLISSAAKIKKIIPKNLDYIIFVPLIKSLKTNLLILANLQSYFNLFWLYYYNNY